MTTQLLKRIVFLFILLSLCRCELRRKIVDPPPPPPPVSDSSSMIGKRENERDSQITALNKQIDFLKLSRDATAKQLQDLAVVNSSRPESIKKSMDGLNAADVPVSENASTSHQRSSGSSLPPGENYLAMKEGALGDVVFYCPPKLREGTPEKVIASLGKFVDITSLKNNILDFVNDVRKQESRDPITQKDIVEKKINLLDSVDIELEDPSGRIGVVPEKNQAQWRKLNDSVAENWGWYITPNKDEGGKADGSLFLTVWTKNAGARESLFSKQYNIPIELPETIWQAFLRKLRDIGWLFTTLGSIIGFLAGRWKRKEGKDSRKPNLA